MNKYLEKIAADTSYNYHYIDDGKDPEELRREAIDEANEVLVRHGFKPTLDYGHAGSAVNATDLGHRDFRAGLRPNEVDANKNGLIAGLLSGGAVGLGVGLATSSGGLGAMAGITTGIIGGGLLKRHIYTPDLKAEDETSLVDQKNKFVEYLKTKYQQN